MDCPILCADSENKTSCPDANCPLFDGQNETCFLQQADAFLERDDLPAATRAALQRLRDAGQGLLSDTSNPESNLSFLVSEVEDRRKSQEQLLQALSRSEASDGALRGEVRTLVDRLATLESGLGNLEEKLGSVGRAVGALQTDQFRVAEQLVGDLSRPIDAMASRLEEGAVATRRVLEELSVGTDNLTAQGQEMSRELHTVAVRQEEHDSASCRRQDALAQNLEEILCETGKLSAGTDNLTAQGQEMGQELHTVAVRQEEHEGAAGRRQDALAQNLEAILGETGKLSGQVADLASQQEGGFGAGRQRQEELLGKVVEVFSLARDLTERVDALGAQQESAMTETEQSGLEHRRQLDELKSALDGHLDSLGTRMEEHARRVESPLDGTRAALETWQGEAGQVLEALRQRDVEDQRGRQRAREEESRELNARGVLLFHQGSLEAAERAFRRAVELRPDFAEAHNNLGLVQSRLGQEDAAVDSFQKAMSCGQELPAALNNLGFLYHAQMRDAEAVEMFQKALEADPTMAPAFVNLGNAYYRQGNHAQALDAWRRALELDPVNEDAERAIRSFDMQADTARA